MRTENEIREQIKYLETPNEIAGLPVDGSIAASWLKWVLNAEQGGNVPAANACPQLYDAEATREKLASYAHKQWSGWMDYLFSKCVNPIEADTGTVIIPKWAVERWKRQIETPYEELSEPEKESDRKEADGMLEIICRSFI